MLKKTTVKTRNTNENNVVALPLPAPKRGLSTPSTGAPLPKSGADQDPSESPNQKKEYRLDGHFARRLDLAPGLYWDDRLPGFGLRVAYKSRSWIVQTRDRGETRRVTIGKCGVVSAKLARRNARQALAVRALDGLPVRPEPASKDASTTFAAFLPVFWEHCGDQWKPLTQRRARSGIRAHLEPAFGDLRLFEIRRADVMAWRDGMAQRTGAFNRTLPTLSAILERAELLGYRARGTNPCKGIARYKRPKKERFLSLRELQRLGNVLREFEGERPLAVAGIRLLIYTGARKSEVVGLRWEWVGQNYADLPDSKTGPKRLYLNRQANAVLDRVGRKPSGRVFEAAGRSDPLDCWPAIRDAAGMNDLRLHDLRHSFASIAIMQGISLTKIGALLGHALPETTFRYAHLSDDSVQEAAIRVSGSIAKAMGVAR